MSEPETPGRLARRLAASFRGDVASAADLAAVFVASSKEWREPDVNEAFSVLAPHIARDEIDDSALLSWLEHLADLYPQAGLTLFTARYDYAVETTPESFRPMFRLAEALLNIGLGGNRAASRLLFSLLKGDDPLAEVLEKSRTLMGNRPDQDAVEATLSAIARLAPPSRDDLARGFGPLRQLHSGLFDILEKDLVCVLRLSVDGVWDTYENIREKEKYPLAAADGEPGKITHEGEDLGHYAVELARNPFVIRLNFGEDRTLRVWLADKNGRAVGPERRFGPAKTIDIHAALLPQGQVPEGSLVVEIDV